MGYKVPMPDFGLFAIARIPLVPMSRCIVEHHRWRDQSQARMMMLLVILTKKSLAESTTVFQTSEAVRELRPILRRAELPLRVRVVVRDMWPAVGLGNAPIGQQEGYWFGGQGGAAIGMQRELTGRIPV